MKHTKLGELVRLRTYARPWGDSRESWEQTVDRAVDFNTSLAPTSLEEKEKLNKLVYQLGGFLSGRTLWAGGHSNGLANFNCAFTKIECFEDFVELFYLSMLGSGVGYRIFPEDVAKIDRVRTDIELHIPPYEEAENKLEHSELIFADREIVKGYHDYVAIINVGDSKDGWAEALRMYFQIMADHHYKNVSKIFIDLNSVRPKGSPIKGFGGTASGHESMEKMFFKIHKVLTANDGILKPIDALDIATIIGENVVSGGVRRTALISLVHPDDTETINAKQKIYYEENGEWKTNLDILHRVNSNNSILYFNKPTREQLEKQIQNIKATGEPGFINGEAAKRRKPSFEGTNPCGEILLESKQTCNLTTLNIMEFVEDNAINMVRLQEAMELISRANFRMTFIELELQKWDRVRRNSRICGVSLTGWQDAMSLVKLNKDEQAKLLQNIRAIGRHAVEEYAKELGVEAPNHVTTVKPEGTQSLMPTVSAGIHYSFAPYFIRRVRISASDPLLEQVRKANWRVLPEVGQTEEDANTYVIEFPVKSASNRTVKDISALEQLENYKLFMENYVDHNASVTISVKENEWESVTDWIWDNWDTVVGITLLADNGGVYPLMPYEEITEEEYLKRKKEMKNLNQKTVSFGLFDEPLDDPECSTGACPVR